MDTRGLVNRKEIKRVTREQVTQKSLQTENAQLRTQIDTLKSELARSADGQG